MNRRPSRSCPICACPASVVVYRAGGVCLLRCARCTHVHSDYMAPENYDGYWGEERDITPEDFAESSFYWRSARMPVYREFLSRFSAYRGRVLDVGAGLGFFVRAARDRGWDAWGYEISPAAVRAGRRFLSLQHLQPGRVEDSGFAPGTFDAVTLWDVIEHIPDPPALLRYCRRVLRPGGVVFMQTPNVRFHLLKARILGRLPGAQRRGDVMEVRHHLNDFTFRSMARALSGAGFIRPRFPVLLPTFTMAGSRGLAGVAAKLGYYLAARMLDDCTASSLRVSNTIHAAAFAPESSRG